VTDPRFGAEQMAQSRGPLLLLGLLLFEGLSAAFRLTPSTVPQGCQVRPRTALPPAALLRPPTLRSGALGASSGDEEGLQDEGELDSRFRTLSIHGLSVGPEGFVALLLDGVSRRILPVRVDRTADIAESAEALTLLQLFQGIDMAGPLLPPDILAVRYAECVDLDFEVNDERYSYRSASDWLRARCGLPSIELIQVVVAGRSDGSQQAVQAGGEDTERYWNLQLQFQLYCSRTSGVISSVVLDDVSPFEAMALALRYRSSARFSAESHLFTPESGLTFPENDVPVHFPLWKSADDAMVQSQRVTSRLLDAYETHRLDAALRVAQKLGDTGAEERIRQELLKYNDNAARSEDIPMIDKGQIFREAKSTPTADSHQTLRDFLLGRTSKEMLRRLSDEACAD